MGWLRGFALVVATALMLCGVAAAQPRTRGLAIMPDEERRSHIVDVIGQADIPAEQRVGRTDAQERALRDAALASAKQAALLKVGKELDGDGSLTLRPDRGLEDVTVLGTRDGAAGSDRFELAVRAEVRVYPKTVLPGTPTAAAPPGGAQPAAEQVLPLTVSIRTDRKEYAEGEEMVVTLKGNRDFYGRITYEDASGVILQVLPNAYRTSAKFSANTEYRVPGNGDRFRLRVGAPFGQERFTIYASTESLGEIATTPSDPKSGISVAQNDRPDLARRTRGLTIVESPPAEAAAEPAKPAATPVASRSPSVEFFEATWLVTTRPAGAPPTAAPAAPANRSKQGAAQPRAQPAAPALASSPRPSPTKDDTSAFDSRLPRECTPALGRSLLLDINAMKPIRNSTFSIIDLENFATQSAGHDGLTCSATLAVSNGERVAAVIRIYISSLDEMLLELRLV